MKQYDNGELKDQNDIVSVEDANRKWNAPVPPSKDYSQAANSSITSVDQDNSNARDAVIKMITDVKQQREEIDKLNQSVTYIAEKMSQIAQVVDQQSKILNQAVGDGGAQRAQTHSQGMDIEKLGSLMETMGPILDRVFPKETSAPPLIDNTTIQEKMKQTFFDNLETGESINNFIKNSLKKSVTKNVINTSLKDIGNSAHEPA